MKKFTRQVSFSFLSQMFSLLMSIAAAAIIARWLGPEGKGILALALLIPGILGLMLSGGIGVANVYFIGSRRLDVPTLTRNAVAFTLIGTVLGFIAICVLLVTGLLGKIIPGVPIWIIMVAMIGFPFGLLSGYFSTILQGLQRIMTINILNFAQAILNLGLTALFVIWLKMSFIGVLVGSLIAGVFILIGFGILIRKEGGVFKPSWNPIVIRSTLAFGLKGHIGNLFQFFNYRLDLFIVNYFLGAAGVGIYTVSARFAELLWYFPNAVGFVIFPKAASAKPEQMNKFTPRVFGITLGLTSFGALLLALLGKPAIQFIYSSAFLGAYAPMLFLLPGVVLLGAAKVLTNEIAGRGYPHYNSINAGLTLILTVALDLILIPRYGIIGAALASSITYTTIFFTAIYFYLIVSRKIRGLEAVSKFSIETSISG